MLGLGLSLGLAPIQGVVAPAWVLRDEAGSPPLLDVDWEKGRYWYGGKAYASAAELYAALGVVTVVSGNRITIGPNPTGDELILGAELNSSGDIAAWTAGPNTTLSQVTGGMRVANGSGGTNSYAYQAISDLTVGRSYILTASDIGAGQGGIRVGTTAGANDVALNGVMGVDVPDGAEGSWTFSAPATTVYIHLRVGSTSNGVARDFGRCSVKASEPFGGFSQAAGTVAVKWTAAASPSTTEQIVMFTDRYGSGATINPEKLEISVSSPYTSVVFLIRKSNSVQANISSGTVFASESNTAAAAWSAADIQVSANGENPSSGSTSSGTIPGGIDRIHIGHVNGSSQMAGTLRRFTYFARRVPTITARAAWYDRFPGALHIIGDSFANTTYFLPAVQSTYSGRKVTIDGVGGSTLTQQAARYALTPALWDRTLIIMDGGIETGPAAPLTEIIGRTTDDRWIYVQPSPGNKATAESGAPSNFENWTDWLAEARTVVSDAHYVAPLAALQAANDGSPTDLADVAFGCVPSSLLTDAGAAKLHEGAAASTIRVAAIKAKTDANPSLLA